ncbi:MAG: hypothetical protein RL341_78, partial [Pseudomonadota bacterium]
MVAQPVAQLDEAAMNTATTSRAVIPAQAGIQGTHQMIADVQLGPGLANGQPVLSLTKGRDDDSTNVVRRAFTAFKALDPRLLQITFLGTFLTIGVFVRDFALLWQQIALTFAAALLTQAIWLQAKGLQHKGYLSALVTCFGISILVRAENYWVHPLVAAIAISSKFLIRYEYAPGKHSHLFNPANLAAVVAGYLLPGAWLSPGQWGQAITLAVWFFVLG